MDNSSENIEKEYYLLKINIKKPLNDKISLVINTLEGNFSKTDFFFEIEDSKLNFYLKSIDLDRFKATINDLIIKYELDDSQAKIFKELISKIENITPNWNINYI